MTTHDLARLKLAFAYHLAELVVDADGQVQPMETAFLERAFPRAHLAEQGLIDDEGAWTTVFSATVEEALRVLPNALSRDEKGALMEVLRQASASDQEGAHEHEQNVLLVAARLLGLNPSEWIGG